MDFKTQGVCSRSIHFEVKDNKVTNVSFVGGCSGNTQGVARLVEGMDIDDAIRRLDGIQCGPRPTFLSRSAGQSVKAVQRKPVIAARACVKKGVGKEKWSTFSFPTPFLLFSVLPDIEEFPWQ